MRIKIFGRIIAVPLWAKYALLAFIGLCIFSCRKD